MTLKDVLISEAESAYSVTEKLYCRITNEELSWKPETGQNWMTLGQLLMHCSAFGCGKAIQGFITGEWGFTQDESNEEAHLLPASALPEVKSVEEAFTILQEDKKIAFQYINEAVDSRLMAEIMPAPWGGPELPLFQHLLHMIEHLVQHKGQLFYYLKLMGKDVSTPDLWGA